MAALKVVCEKKDTEIQQLDQSLSQLFVNKEEISAKLRETAEALAQANKELVKYREKVCCINCMLYTYSVPHIKVCIYFVITVKLCTLFTYIHKYMKCNSKLL